MPDRITHEILAEIVGIAADAVICMDEKQLVTFFNQGAEKIFGWTPEEIIGQRIEVLIPERYRAHHEEQVAGFGRSHVKARRMGERKGISGLRKNGEEFPAEAAISQVRQAEGVIYAVVLRDISVRKKFERRQEFLAAAGERLASSYDSGEVLEDIVELAVPTLADGCILESRVEDGFRAGAVAHSDSRVDQVLQRITASAVRNPAAGHPLCEVLRTRAPVLLQTGAVANIVDASTSATYIDGIRAMDPQAALFLPLVARGQFIGVLCLFRSNGGFDADDRGFADDLARLAALALDNSRLLDAVRGSLRDREEMVGVVSHDLRNPVAAIRMLSSALLKGSDNTAPASREGLSLIAEAANQMDALIGDLLDATRLEAGMLAIAPEAVEVSALLTEALRTLQPLVEEKRLDLELQIGANLPKVVADSERIQQALSNLVGNAIKFTPTGGKIVVEALAGFEDVTVSVADTGIGISEEDLPRVFDRYWQSTRTNRQGAGLGLAIAKGIIESHGGSLWLESRVGKGTIAQFSLPVAAIRKKRPD
jgi:PAS domain S-box-containing protein